MVDTMAALSGGLSAELLGAMSVEMTAERKVYYSVPMWVAW